MTANNNLVLKAPVHLLCFRGYCQHCSLCQHDFKKKYPNKQTRLHLFCPPFLQNGHLIIYIFQGLVKISVTEDGVSRALPPSLLFSPGKSFDFILGNIFQTKPRFGWGFHKKNHISNTIFGMKT